VREPIANLTAAVALAGDVQETEHEAVVSAALLLMEAAQDVIDAWQNNHTIQYRPRRDSK
jgi:hypothetical protein